ncbi:uncharacterized protein VTP21DRAFT_8938 [Calcarisporiella thermophila]|uniref:uncharacterized protein n=1 Tax=Calcarisporiella thermophila TaxID=911321 RepID=UPI00374274F8
MVRLHIDIWGGGVIESPIIAALLFRRAVLASGQSEKCEEVRDELVVKNDAPCLWRKVIHFRAPCIMAASRQITLEQDMLSCSSEWEPLGKLWSCKVTLPAQRQECTAPPLVIGDVSADLSSQIVTFTRQQLDANFNELQRLISTDVRPWCGCSRLIDPVCPHCHLNILVKGEWHCQMAVSPMLRQYVVITNTWESFEYDRVSRCGAIACRRGEACITDLLGVGRRELVVDVESILKSKETTQENISIWLKAEGLKHTTQPC